MRSGTGKKGIGIVGYGGFGEYLHKTWKLTGGVEVVAVCDSRAQCAPDDVMFYSNIQDLLADPKVDTVSIATPPSSHCELALQSLAAGKHVLVEKPLALSELDARRIEAAAREAGKVVMVDFMLRYNPIVESVGKIIREEVLGKLRRIDLRNYATLEQTPEGHWFWNPEISGGIFLEHGVHFFDLAHYYTGSEASEVCSITQERKPGIEDEVFAGVHYENGIIGTFWHSFSRPRPIETTTFHLAFDLGEVDVIGWIPLEMRLWGWTDQKGMDVLRGLIPRLRIQEDSMDKLQTQSSDLIYEVDRSIRAHGVLERPKLEEYSGNLRAIMTDMVNAIDTGATTKVTLDDGIEAVRVAQMATECGAKKS